MSDGHRNRLRFFKLCAVFFAALLSWAAVEIALQLFDYPPRLRAGWRTLAPEVFQNQLGFRGRPIKYADDDFVIVLVGDSQVEAGYSAGFEGIPETRLEQALHQRGVTNAKVFSIGVDGWSQDQQLMALSEFYEDHGFRADLVIVWETPYNDVWNNLFPNQWVENSIPKPTFRLENGRLIEPRWKRIGEPMVSGIKTVATVQKLTDSQLRVMMSDKRWASQYLPKPYVPLTTAVKPDLYWQFLRDRRFGWMYIEDFTNDKNNYSIGMMPVSARMKHGLELTNALLHEMRKLVEERGGEFMAFNVDTPTSRLYKQDKHEEPRDYQVDNRYYRYSFAQERSNIEQMNKGIRFREIACTLEDWRVSEMDWHLNSRAIRHTMGCLADALIDMYLVEPPTPANQTP